MDRVSSDLSLDNCMFGSDSEEEPENIYSDGISKTSEVVRGFLPRPRVRSGSITIESPQNRSPNTVIVSQDKRPFFPILNEMKKIQKTYNSCKNNIGRCIWYKDGLKAIKKIYTYDQISIESFLDGKPYQAFEKVLVGHIEDKVKAFINAYVEIFRSPDRKAKWSLVEAIDKEFDELETLRRTEFYQECMNNPIIATVSRALLQPTGRMEQEIADLYQKQQALIAYQEQQKLVAENGAVFELEF